jgi:hypothetical protein
VSGERHLPSRPIPCALWRRFTCRHWTSQHWWAAVEMDWDDYMWMQYGQYGETGP